MASPQANNEIQLIKIKESKGDQLVSARELHEFLGSKRDFTSWIKTKIDRYGFQKDEDFTFTKIGEYKKKRHDYVLTLDCAKEIAMVEGNDKGRQARRYFIACEKKLRSKIEQLSPLQLLKTAVFELEEKEKEILELKPKAEEYEKWLGSDGTICHTLMATDLGVSCQKFHKILKTVKVMRKVDKCWVFTAKHNQEDFQKTLFKSGLKPNGEQWESSQVKLLPPGAVYIDKNWDEWLSKYNSLLST